MFKFYKILFLNTLVMGTLIAISSYSWFSMWMGLEINLLSIIPLLTDPKNIYPSESALKYFITQAMASSVLLFSIIMSMNLNEFLPQNSYFWMLMMMNSALLTKMGAAPFHFWFPEVMEGLNWANSLIMLTWQSIAPMVLLMYKNKMTMFVTFIIMFSAMISGVQGINQVSLRKILAYSSINHIAWMIASMLNSLTIWPIYFIVYSVITSNIVVMFKQLNVFYLNQLFNSMNESKMMKLLFILNFLSLGGLPPFLGFFPKWLTINNLAANNFFAISLILIIFTLVTLFFYLRVTFSTLVINSNETLIYQKSKNHFLIFFTNLISLAGLIVCTLILNYF
uniref:NADH-ubiquinone oxidoreductase chain 2 n=1 Tax=Massicus raddei TaxID=157316 RepID=X2CEJ5_MASRA|nr:NADH dehydrogenase subunit 2 [Massicus raddei]AGO01994.1 NADH dehydrogenase subunit 2 [Massicus raddei]